MTKTKTFLLRCILAVLLMMVAPAMHATVTLTGSVADESTGEPIAFASVVLSPGGHGTTTDAAGRFALSAPEGNYTVTVSFVGYHSVKRKLSLTTSQSLHLKLKENSNMLEEVVVTAKESTGVTSTSRIDRDAMTHLQPTSFTDLLELLPGNMSKTPDMGSANTITLRETGTMGATGTATDNPDYAISSLGTLFVVDGAPINGDANMQNVPGSSGESGAPESKRDITNRGVDMRTISTDNIESVEVVRGIPSAEFGNLTSGMVNIKRIRRATPLTARFKADEYSKLLSVGKGFHLGKSDHIMNVDGSYLDSKVDPRNKLENYKRVTVSARANLNWHRVNWVTGVDYTGSFDNSKTDPDLSYNKVNEYKSSYNRFNFTSNLTISFNTTPWLKLINVNTSASYQRDRLERHRQVAPQRASVAPTSMEAGEHDGQYLLSEYIADYLSDGRPLNVFVKAKLEGGVNVAGTANNYKVGGEWTLSKNYGRGQVYDITRPLSASWPTRPRAYRDVPALDVLSFYIEDDFTAPVGATTLNVQAGVRSINLTNLSGTYALDGKVYLDPRVNVKWSLPAFKWRGRKAEFYVAGGYGLTTKMPTIAYLFPQVHYNDFIQLNYYDVNSPATLSRVSLRTYIDDVTNYGLRAARNHKWEVRVGGSLGKNTFSVTYFNEKMTSGYRYSSYYTPYAYRKYDVDAIDATALTAPPALEALPYEDVRVLDGYSRAANGSRLDKQGVEFVITTARWRPLATALTVTGAWFRTTYTNSQMMYDPVSDVIDNTIVRNRYIGYYDYNDGRVNEQFNTNFMFDTQITRWGLIFSTSIQCMWYTSTKKLWQNGVPTSYLDVNDGVLHPFTDESRHDALLQTLVRTYNDDIYRRLTTPIALYVNLKATKQMGKHLRIAVFANRLLDYLPDYKSNGLTVRRNTDAYFGMELNFSL